MAVDTALAPALERALALLEPEARAPERVAPGGYLDLLGANGPQSTGAVQDLMLTGLVPRIYERWWRPPLARIAKGVLGPGTRDEQRIARLLLGLAPGDGVLDIACGTGNFSRSFARTVGPGGLVVGLDVSDTMLARAVTDTRAAGLDDRVAYVRASAQKLPFRAAGFDAVCCFLALHLFGDPMRALDGMANALTPGGRIAIFTTVRGRSAPLRTVESVVAGRGGAQMFERAEIVDALRERGFHDIRQRITGVMQFVGGRLP